MKRYTKNDARAKVGDVVMIDGFEPNSDGSLPRTEMTLIGKTGRVQLIDDSGAIHGTWGGISLLPCDDYHIVEEA
jgi:hypothetical protein